MTQTFEQALAAFAPALPLAVAFSGGADSTALLAACARKWPGQVVAFHVNHGLQAAAAGFEAHCQAVCAQLGVPLRVLQVDARPTQGQSPEDAARIARYKAFEALALVEYAQAAIYSVAIAQHADDQAETLLLALARGAGLPGLSAMPACWVRSGLTYHRPLLGVAGVGIRAWLAQQALPFVQDPSNADARYTRNRLRQQLMPALGACFPHFRDTLARSAAHAAQAQALLTELAQSDLAQVGTPPRLQALQRLSVARMGNVLRHWLRLAHGVVPSAAQLAELIHQVQACTTRGHRLHIKVANGFCVRQGEALHWYTP
jgi:tRNA(Ile)-lysidine synthase